MESPDMIRTTVYIPKDLLISAKTIAVLTKSNVSTLVRYGLKDKIKEIKEKSYPQH
jgi:hypothetical protein